MTPVHRGSLTREEYLRLAAEMIVENPGLYRGLDLDRGIELRFWAEATARGEYYQHGVPIFEGIDDILDAACLRALRTPAPTEKKP